MSLCTHTNRRRDQGARGKNDENARGSHQIRPGLNDVVVSAGRNHNLPSMRGGLWATVSSWLTMANVVSSFHVHYHSDHRLLKQRMRQRPQAPPRPHNGTPVAQEA